MNNDKININENENLNKEFDLLLQQIKKHSQNKKHSKERLNNIIAFALEENRKFEEERKTALAHQTSSTKSYSIKDFFTRLIGVGKPKVLIPRLAFLASIIIIVTVSIFYLSSPDTDKTNQEYVRSTQTEINKETELKIEQNQLPPKEIEISKQETQSKNKIKISTSTEISQKDYINEKVDLQRNEPPTSPALGSLGKNEATSPKSAPDAPPIETNISRGFQFLSHRSDQKFDTILEAILDTERGVHILQKGDSEQVIIGNSKDLNFARYKQVLEKFNIETYEIGDDLITGWFILKNVSNAPYNRFIFKIDPTNSRYILVIKENNLLIPDTSNIKTLTNKEYKKIIELLK